LSDHKQPFYRFQEYRYAVAPIFREELMNIRRLLKSSDTIVGIRNDLQKIQRLLRWKLPSAALGRYVDSNKVRKLQIGSGPIAIQGWLGTDLRPTDTVAFLDATKVFPIEDQLFDYIHSEHMIEHLAWLDGQAMLRECWRILKPGGTIRIATPDLQVFASLYDHKQGSLAERYIKWITDLYLQGTPAYHAGFIINSIFYRWDHKFVYDGWLLEMALREAGFTEVKRFVVGQSDDENLMGIEMHGKIGNYTDEMNAFETMVFEGKRPK
jgi:predicted SAM-dependent methyltransferase